ncbi:MAG: 3-deoxy-D-manno-octulosonic acid transferase [Candidatus Omnitrophota bacterium]|nr:3-deoxy-D-manno-octulosonic acid transferase [Candidatus Omnitrophota bacterium]
MQILYNIFFTVFALAYLPYFLIKRKGNKGLLQRLGIFGKDDLRGVAGNRPVWIHAVSVGEMKTSESLINRIRALFPSKRFVISNITKTGHDIALSIADKNDVVIYLPLDISFIVRKVVNLINPSVVIIIETEIWPNLIAELYAKNIPVALMNGRISQKSFKNYSIIKPVMKDILSRITLFAMRAKDDAVRIIALGAPPERVKITGNMKFDMIYKTSEDINKQWFPIEHRNLWLADPAKLIIAGSTHRGEEAKVLKSFKAVKKKFAEACLLIAPRHIERTDEVAALTEKFGFKPVRMSEIMSGKDMHSGDNNVFILDSIGYLKPLYQLASVVFMGGSLIPHGGHNFVEPAAYAKPIVTGPFVHNFKDMSELFIKENALETVKDEEGLEHSLKRLISDECLSRSMGENARKVVLDNVGSTERNCLLIMDLVYHA